MSDLICVGAIAGSYGVRGEVRLKSFCADPEAIENYALFTEGKEQEFQASLTRQIKNGFAARLSGVASKEQAEALKGTQLFATRDQLPDLPDDEYYYTDLVDLDVLDTGGALLGRVRSVQNHGAADLLEVQTADAAGTVLLPFTKAIVPTVDLKAGRIVTDPPAGLFDD